MSIDFYSQISRNKKMTYFLFLAFFILIGFLAYVFSSILEFVFGIGFIFIFSIFGFLTIVFAVVAYYSSDKIVVAASGAKEATVEQFKQLHNIVEELCLASGLPKPKIFFINDSAINAFATGRDPQHAVVCVTIGCLSRLNREQLQGVLAHELTHIKNYDVRTMTVATVLVGIAVMLSDFLLRMFLFGSFRSGNSKNSGGIEIALIVLALVLAILTPIIAKLISLSISRKREFSADAGAAEITRNPEGLASALELISKDTEVLEAANKATAHLYIADPLKNTKGLWLKSLFNTHPPIKERISVLRGQKVQI